MIKSYTYTVQGTGSNGQTWTTTGRVNSEAVDLFDTVMEDSFRQLTNGKAVYGHPGVGCNGPYEMLKAVIELVRH